MEHPEGMERVEDEAEVVQMGALDRLQETAERVRRRVADQVEDALLNDAAPDMHVMRP